MMPLFGKNIKLKMIFLLIAGLGYVQSYVQASLATPLIKLCTTKQCDSEDLAAKLGWVVSNKNYCGGYYLNTFIAPAPSKQTLANAPIHILAHSFLLKATGRSTLTGAVSISQLGRKITGDKVYLYRHPQTGEFYKAHIVGKVRMIAQGLLLTAAQATV